MRGIARGEQSTALNPLLQLYTRSGQFMADPVSGSFIIQDIKDPDGLPTIKAGPTPLDLTDVGVGGHKLGTGRFLIPSGGTGSWSVGTHRVIYDYVMVTGGPTYKQIIEFEILNPIDFPTGQTYFGYTSTKALYRHGFAVFSVTAPDILHPHIRAVSAELEGLTDRFFEPRHFTMQLSGHPKGILFVDEAIIAIEKVETISYSTNPTTAQLFDPESYLVANRHLDGLLNPDDRYNPLLSLVTSSVGSSLALWPTGRQNVAVTGVFGFTDPDPQSDGVLIGHTPDDFVQIVGTLATRRLEDPSFSNLATWKPGLVKTYKTRDQMISFYGASGNVNYTGGLTGDALIDQKLLRFVKPARLSYPDLEPRC